MIGIQFSSGVSITSAQYLTLNINITPFINIIINMLSQYTFQLNKFVQPQDPNNQYYDSATGTIQQKKSVTLNKV